MQVQQRSPRAARLVFVVLLTLAALVVAACGSDDDVGRWGAASGRSRSSSSPARRRTRATEAEQAAIVKRFDDEHPDIEVKREAVEINEMRTILKTRLVSGSGPDVFSYDTGPATAACSPRPAWSPRWTTPTREVLEHLSRGRRPARPTAARPTPSRTQSRSWESSTTTIVLQARRAAAEDARELDDVADAASSADSSRSRSATRTSGRPATSSRMTCQQPARPRGTGRDPLRRRRSGTIRRSSRHRPLLPPVPGRGLLPEGRQRQSTTTTPTRCSSRGKAAMLPTGTWLVSEITAKQAPFEVGFFPFPSIDGSTVAPPAGVGGGLFVVREVEEQGRRARVPRLALIQDDSRASRGRESSTPSRRSRSTRRASRSRRCSSRCSTDLGESSRTTAAFGYNIDVLTPARFNEVDVQRLPGRARRDADRRRQQADAPAGGLGRRPRGRATRSRSPEA